MGKLKDPAEARGFIMGIHKACQKIRQIPVPVIARVNGYALGGGLEVAAACDMRVAVRREGVFGMPEVCLCFFIPFLLFMRENLTKTNR